MSLWRWHGTLVPHDSSALTDHIDFFPTIAELAGAKLDEKIAAQSVGRRAAAGEAFDVTPRPSLGTAHSIGNPARRAVRAPRSSH